MLAALNPYNDSTIWRTWNGSTVGMIPLFSDFAKRGSPSQRFLSIDYFLISVGETFWNLVSLKTLLFQRFPALMLYLIRVNKQAEMFWKLAEKNALFKHFILRNTTRRVKTTIVVLYGSSLCPLKASGVDAPTRVETPSSFHGVRKLKISVICD